MSPMRSRSSSGEVRDQAGQPGQEEFKSEIKRTVVSRSRSRSKSKSRSRSRTRSSSRKRSSSTRRRSYDRSRSRSREGYRLHVGDINEDCRKRDLERIFSKYGPLKEIWLATYAPFYAFVNYESRDDMEYAVKR